MNPKDLQHVVLRERPFNMWATKLLQRSEGLVQDYGALLLNRSLQVGVECSQSTVFADLEKGATDTALQRPRGLWDSELVVEDGMEIR